MHDRPMHQCWQFYIRCMCQFATHNFESLTLQQFFAGKFAGNVLSDQLDVFQIMSSTGSSVNGHFGTIVAKTTHVPHYVTLLSQKLLIRHVCV